MGYGSDFRRFLYREFVPVTKGTVVLMVAVTFLSLLLGVFGVNLSNWLRLNPSMVWVRPWTLLTFPLVNDIVSTVFAAVWLWFIGSSLERTWGTKRYCRFLLLAVLITGLAFAGVKMLTRESLVAYGMWLPLTGVTWAWSEIYPDRDLMLWGMIPVKARWLAWIHAVLIFASYVNYHLLYALAAVSSIVLVYWKVPASGRGGKGRRPAGRSRMRVVK